MDDIPLDPVTRLMVRTVAAQRNISEAAAIRICVSQFLSIAGYPVPPLEDTGDSH